MVFFFLLLVAATLTHFMHDGHWDEEQKAAEIFAHPERPVPIEWGGGVPIPAGGFAPNAYRVLLPAITRAVQHLPLLHNRLTAETVIEAFFATLALWLAYLLLASNLSNTPGTGPYRAIAVAALLATVQLPLPWVLPFLRMETLPAACFVIGAILIMVRVESWPLRAFLLAALSFAQALNRAEIPAALGAGVLLLTLLSRRFNKLGTKFQLVASGIGMLAIGAGVQLYMKYVEFPNNPYPPGAPAFSFFLNLTAHSLGIFAVAIAPLLALLVALRINSMRLCASELLILTYSAFSFLPWVTMGQIQEVRIYVPAMLACAVVAARLLAFLLGPEFQEQCENI